jgi:hypothetical protein
MAAAHAFRRSGPIRRSWRQVRTRARAVRRTTVSVLAPSAEIDTRTLP